MPACHGAAHLGATAGSDELAQQLIAGDVTAGVVDHLELVEVDVAERVLDVALAGAPDQPVQALLELAAVDQTGEGVVGGLVLELRGQPLLVGHVPRRAAVAAERAARVEARAPAGTYGAPVAARAEDAILDVVERGTHAKYHVPASVPYSRYFLAHILQFQFHRELCKTAGNTGPLHRCSIYGSKEAGKKIIDMLEMGSSRPWQEALETMTGSRDMDASAIIDYFAPLKTWLDEQNKDRQCGW